MRKIKKIVWRSGRDDKDLIQLAEGKIVCLAYEVTREEVQELQSAIEQVLELTEPDDPNAVTETRTV